jgi:peptidoglycan-associated lipoprotein
MRRVLLLALCVTGILAVGGCKPKVKPGECKASADCEKQEGYGKVCVEGRCQECAADTDCKEGFACVGNRCEPKPQCSTDDQCPPGQSCVGQQCVAREAGACGSDRDCGPDQQCQDGRCAARAAAAAPEASAECADAGAFTVRFSFNEASLSGDSQAKLQKLADCLKASPAARVVAEGYADERGTAQYNVALGNRRAEAARKYLSDLGVAGKTDTVSFGEEKALCSESTESCWEQNRRVEFQVER